MATRTASPGGRGNTGSRPRLRFAALAAAASILVIAAQAHAQSRDADAELEALIPDSALDDPEGWATDTAAAEVGQPDDPDPDTPLADEGFRLAWPGNDDPIDDIEPLEPDPQLAEALDLDLPPEVAELALPEMGTASGLALADLVDVQISDRITLSYPAEFAEFDQYDAFEDRFMNLSKIRELADNDDTLAQLANRARTDQAMMEDLLRVYGFFDGDARQEVTTPPEGQGTGADGTVRAADARFSFTLDPGPRYTYSAVDLGDLDDATADYEDLRASFEIAAGDFINQDEIVQERIDLDFALGETGYAFADVGSAELTIDHATDDGVLALPVFPGGKYNFGAVVSGNEEFLSGKHLSNIARFDPGDVYQASKLEDLRRAILATGLVSTLNLSATEVVDPANGQPGTVDIEVELTEAPLRTVAGALGYSTGEGLRAEVSWEHRNFFPPEGMVRARAVAGTQEQLLGLTYRRNNWKGRDKVLTADLFANNIDRDAYEARTISAIAKYERVTTLIFQKPIAYSIGAEIVATQEREGALDGSVGTRETYFVAALPGRLALDESDDLLNPTRGWRAAIIGSPEFSRNEDTNTQSTYLRAQLEGSYYQSVTDNVVLAARAAVGTIVGAATGNIAPSRRLYAGGGGSVRGYGYQEIGPKDTLGDPTGGRSLSEFSLEARVRTGLFDGALGIVPFIDAGAVDDTTTPRLSDLRVGAGIGVRYFTSFGPLRIDLATPLNPRPGDSRIAVYVALGQAF